MESRISIITPSLNQARFLPYNLESVWNQSLAPSEQIILDPGSIDGSREIARQHPKARLIAEPDTGQANAICRGFREAKGEILAWLNSDDMYAGPDVFSAVVERFSAPDAPDVVYGLVDFVDENNTFVKKGFINPNPDSLISTFHYQVGILQPGVFIKKQVFDQVGGPPEDMEFTIDYEYWVRIALAGFRWGYIPKLLAHHRWWSEMKTASRRDESYLEHLKTVKKHFGYVHHKWADRYAECLVAGTDGIIVPAGGSAATENKSAISAKKEELLEQFNSDFDSLTILNDQTAPQPVKETAAQMREVGISLSPRGVPTNSPNNQVKVTGFARPGDSQRATAWRRYFAVRGSEKLTGYEVGDFNWVFPREFVQNELEKSRSALERLAKNREHEICIIVGNGPSLNRSDFSLLDQADVLISNFAFYSKPLHRHATYFTTVNRLVAEQGAHEINHLSGCTKFFPFWLASHIRPAEDTFFLDANIRPEFSKDISDWISWRSTVTFFNLQIAYGLGYKKVLMIGFDHFYRQPAGVKEADMIDQKQQDENHFLPNYFMGKKWQAADVGNMEKMYLLAKVAYEADGREIVNCTVGGHLEVFRRGDLKTELGSDNPQSHRSPENSANASNVERVGAPGYPRLLMIDSTPLGSLSATGQLKKTFLGDWPADRFLQIWENHSSTPTLHAIRQNESLESSRSKNLTLNEVVQICRAFQPDAIYFRPVDYPLLMEAAERVIAETQAPLALHIMDDWQERLRECNPSMYRVLDVSLRNLINQASLRWSICDAMSREYFSRYGHPFESLANGVDLADFSLQWESPLRTEVGVFKVRYLGGLAKDMTFQSVMDIANAVSELQAEVPIQFDIHTMDWYWEEAQRAIASLRGVRIQGAVSGEPYYKLLAESDALVIAYNFDPESMRYIRLSLANKMPECLASGAALLAYGPKAVATIEYLRNAGCACVVEERSPQILKQRLFELATDGEKRRTMIRNARDFAARHLSKNAVQERFHAGIVKTATIKRQHPRPSLLPGSHSQELSANIDKNDSAVAILDPKVKNGGMVVDVRQSHALEAAPCYFQARPNRWVYTKAEAGMHKLLIFKHPAIHATANRDYEAIVRVVCDTPIKLAVALARHDPKRPYEGKTLKVDLQAGKPWSAVLKHLFRENHPTLKLQFEILECPTATCTLEIQEMAVQEVPATRPEEPILLTPNSFAQANRLYREGNYAEAHEIYLALHQAHPELEIYKTNAQMALRKINLSGSAV